MIFTQVCGKVPARDYSNNVDKIHVVTGKTIGGKVSKKMLSTTVFNNSKKKPCYYVVVFHE